MKPFQFPKFSPKTPKAFPKVHPDVSQITEGEIRNWSPDDVSRWLRTAGYDNNVVYWSIDNHITGNILLDLPPTETAQLGAYYLAVKASIEYLKSTMQKGMVPESLSRSNSETMSSNGRSTMEGSTHDDHFASERFAVGQVTHRHLPFRQNPSNGQSYTESVLPSGKYLSRNPNGQNGDQLENGDSVSIVAIEENPPKVHSCHKGENCRKYQRDQRRYMRRMRELGPVFIGSPGNPETARNLLPEAGASVVESSEEFAQSDTSRLSEAALSKVQRLDPQESILSFLEYQHVDEYSKHGSLSLDTKNISPGHEVDDIYPPNAQPSSMAAHLRGLPKLRIPGTPDRNSPNTDDMTTAVTTNKYFTPTHEKDNSIAVQEYGPFSHVHEAQSIETYRQGTPFSEMDVPIIAIPNDPIARDLSQSVPPTMQYGTLFPPGHTVNPVERSTSSRFRDVLPLRQVNENKPLTPIEGPADLIRTPRMNQHGFNGSLSSLASDPDVTRAGYLKKRKTSRGLHHWREEEEYITLRGKNLYVHKHERDAHRISRAEETIDVNEYSVACPSHGSKSKLSAALRSFQPKNKSNASKKTYDWNFGLVPDVRNVKTKKRLALFDNGGKSHHFAAETREDRIDWMRELMLQKALHRAKESGDDIVVNGHMI